MDSNNFKLRTTELTKAPITIDRVSTSPEDFISTLNQISPLLGGITNLGVFADIEKVEQTIAIEGASTNDYLSFSLSDHEQPGCLLYRDNSSSNIKDYSFNTLLSDETEFDCNQEEDKISIPISKVSTQQYRPRSFVLSSTVRDFQCSPTERCGMCNGNGKCINCKGKGEHRCKDCAGSGIVKCRHCRGNGQCDSCHGRGSRVCYRCHGSGYEDNGRRCSSCYGRGSETCSACNGSGNCIWCHGSCTEKCSGCWGKGYFTCIPCRGTGNCYNCSGSGDVECSRCKGEGIYQQFTTADPVVTRQSWVFTGSTRFKDILPNATGTFIFNDIIKEWKGIGKIAKDSSLEDVLKNIKQEIAGNESLVDEFFAELNNTPDLSLEDGEHHPYRKALSFKKVLITTIHYDLEGKKYELSFVGDNCIVAYNAIPKKIKTFEEEGWTKFKNNALLYSRAKAYCKLAAYIFGCDNLSKEEERLLRLMAGSLKLSKTEEKKFLDDLRNSRNIDYKTFRKSIKSLLSSKRTLTFAWHCMSIDHEVSNEESKLFNRLAEDFHIKDAEAEKIKSYALKFSYLDDESLVSEYLGIKKETNFGFKTKFASWAYEHVLIATALLLGLLTSIGFTSKLLYDSTKEESDYDNYYESYYNNTINEINNTENENLDSQQVSEFGSETKLKIERVNGSISPGQYEVAYIIDWPISMNQGNVKTLQKAILASLNLKSDGGFDVKNILSNQFESGNTQYEEGLHIDLTAKIESSTSKYVTYYCEQHTELYNMEIEFDFLNYDVVNDKILSFLDVFKSTDAVEDLIKSEDKYIHDKTKFQLLRDGILIVVEEYAREWNSETISISDLKNVLTQEGKNIYGITDSSDEELNLSMDDSDSSQYNTTEKSENQGDVVAYGKYDLGGRGIVGSLPRPYINSTQTGIAVVKIIVNSSGDVVNAVFSSGTTISSEDLRSAVLNAALQAKFNANEDLELETGTITYYFDNK